MLQATTPHVQVKAAVPVRVDVYPATVTFSFDSHNYTRTRAILTADTVLILVEATPSVGVLYEAPLEDVTADRKTVVATTSDGTVTITRGSGCGCGSRLRAYRPFRRAVRLEKIPA